MTRTRDVIGRCGAAAPAGARPPQRGEATRSPGRLLGAGLLVLLGACSGDLAHRSVAELKGAIPLTEGIRRVRLEVDNGTVGLDIQEERTISYAGGARRAADTAEGLALVEAVALELVAAPAPEDPATLVVRAPAVPAGTAGVLAVELGIRLPADLDLVIAIAQNGHVTVANRRAGLEVATGRGDLRFERCQGAIKARTGRGNVIADDHRGDIDVTAAVGDMQVFVREPARSIRLDTGEGTVQCYIPPTAGFQVDARAATGRCGSSFGLEVTKPAAYSAAMTGARGDGRTKIVLRTGKGYLTLGAKDFD